MSGYILLGLLAALIFGFVIGLVTDFSLWPLPLCWFVSWKMAMLSNEAAQEAQWERFNQSRALEQ